MQTTTLSFENMHQHGVLFSNLLRARRESFIVERKWDLPETMGMEFDQYDTPYSRWIAVHDSTSVLAGIRLTPTTAQCGIYTYMIRDAQKGMLDSIPSDLLYDEAPVSDHIWESSRVFVSSAVPSQKRGSVQLSLMTELINAARQMGATQVLGLVPAVWPRWVRRLGIEADQAGPSMEIDGYKNQVAWMHLNKQLH